MNMVQEHVYETFEDNSEELKQFEQDIEIWEASENVKSKSVSTPIK